MEIQRIQPADWNDALLDFPARSVFHRLEWLELVAEATGATLDLAEVRHGGARVGLFPQLVVSTGPLKASGSPLPGWSSAYMGPLADSAANVGRVVEAALAAAPMKKASYTEMRVLDHAGEAADLGALGFERLLRFETYLLDLGRDEDELFAGLASKCRNVVRKGTKNGYEVRVDTDDFIPDFWAMSEEVFGRWGIAPGFDERFLHLLVKHLSGAGLLDVRSAFLGDERAATIVILRDDRTAYYWAGGSFDSHRKSSPNNLLLWECIRAANADGLSTFDFVSSSGSAGKFKKSFGPEEVEVATHWGRSRTRLEGWLKIGYEKYLRARRSRADATKPEDTATPGEGSDK